MREGIRCGCLTAICGLLLLSGFSSACARFMITARIVDAENGQPMKDAIVAYRWYKYEFGPPGLPSKDVTIEAGEELSDAEGTVKIPKYSMLVYELSMVAYKKGYVCWSNIKVFPGWKSRSDFSLEDDVVLRLERLKGDYSNKDHAWFLRSMTTGLPKGDRLNEAVRIEMRFMRDK